MSLVFGTREVSVGPTVGYQGDASPSAYVSKGQLQKKLGGNPPWGEGGKRGVEIVKRNGFCLDGGDSTATSESSSIGCNSSAAGGRESSGEEEEEVQSKFKGGLGDMGLLEESLPIKRGLSNFFRGKSKSFACLSNVGSVDDLAKPENPFNKRRRTLLACKASWRSFDCPLSGSTFTVAHQEESEEEDDDDEKENSPLAPLPTSTQERKFKSFRSPRSFSLTDLRDA